MGVIQQGLNQALTGATFLLNQSPAMKELNKTRAENKAAEQEYQTSLERVDIAKERAQDSRISGIAGYKYYCDQGSKQGFKLAGEDDPKKIERYIYDKVKDNIDTSILREAQHGDALMNLDKQMQNPYIWKKYGGWDYDRKYSPQLGANTRHIEMAQKLSNKLSQLHEQFMNQNQSQKEFRSQLKGLQKSDFDELVKMGINPKVADAGIKQAEKRGEYNGKTNTER